MARRSLLAGAGLVAGALGLLGVPQRSEAGRPQERAEPGADEADAGRMTEHRRAYYRLARF